VTGARIREHACDDAVRWLRCQRLPFCLDAFSSRKPVPTLLENAMVFPIMKTRALQAKAEKKKAGLVRARL